MSTKLEAIGTVICDLDQKILHIDDRYNEIVGRDPSDLIGRPALSFTYRDDLTLNRPALDRLALDGPGFTIVKRYVRGDGKLVWVKNHVTRITDGAGGKLLSATTQVVDRPFGNERLARNYDAARRLSGVLVAGRRDLSTDIVWAPGIEALLLLYRAEVEGLLLTADELAARVDCAPSVMLRWIKLLRDRDLVTVERPGDLSERSPVRISDRGERTLDSLLASLTS